MPAKEKKDKPQKKPRAPRAEETEPRSIPGELTREQLEELRRKLQKKFH